MKKLRFRYAHDTSIKHIIHVMQTHGYEVQTEDALQAWQAYSLTYASHWLSVWAVPEQEIVEAVLSYCDEVAQ